MARRRPRTTETDVSIQGAEQLGELAGALRRAGRGDLKKELVKGLRDAAKPLVRKAKDAYRDELPQRGGLGRFYSRKAGRVQVRTGRDPGVSVVFSKADRRLEEQGRLTHPVFGRRPAVVQRVRPNIISDALSAESGDVRKALVEAVETVAEKIARDARS